MKTDDIFQKQHAYSEKRGIGFTSGSFFRACLQPKQLVRFQLRARIRFCIHSIAMPMSCGLRKTPLWTCARGEWETPTMYYSRVLLLRLKSF